MGNLLEFDSGRPSGNSSVRGAKNSERAPKSRPGHGASGKSKLTQRLINEIRPPLSGKLRLPDGEINGLFLRVTSKGAKSFILRYSMNGRRGEATIGDARSITLVAARAKAVDVLSDLAVRKVDPVHARKAAIRQEKAKKEETFASLVARYQQDAARRKRVNTLTYETWLFEKHVLPKLGERRYADLRRAEIIALIEKVGTSAGPTTANRAHAIVRQVLNFALKRDLIEANPALAIDRVFQENSRDRVLSEAEIQKLWTFLEAARKNEGTGILKDEEQGERAINGLSAPTAIALELCLLTLQRGGEVAGARIEEFSWTDRLWVVPAERMKGKRSHAVPLSGLAMARFQEAFERSGSTFAFVDRSGSNSLDPKRLTRAMNRACTRIDLKRASPHDLRRTGRTMMTSERVGVSYEVAERVIAHLVGSVVSRVYDRNEYAKEKRAALDNWAMLLAQIVRPAATANL